MEKFDTIKIRKQLIAINKKNGLDVTTGVQLIVNNCELYNLTMDEITNGNANRVFLLFQLAGQISKMLERFKIYPNQIKDEEDTEDDAFTKLTKKVKGK